MRERRAGWSLLAIACLLGGSPLFGYVDLAPNLSKVMADSKRIVVVEVTAFDREKHRVSLKEVNALKGQIGTETIIHEVVAADSGTVPRPILQWAQVGARAVVFVSEKNTAMVCYGHGWYQLAALSARGWKLGMERPDLPLAYYGTVSRLVEGVELMLAGKDTVLTVVPHGVDEGAMFDLALNRVALPGTVRVQRIRANLKMPDVVMAVSASAAYVVGMGAVDEKELPALIKRLESADAAVRAEAAGEIGALGSKAKGAVGSLRSLLKDPVGRVRFAAAAGVVKILGTDVQAIGVLGAGLDDQNAENRAAATGAACYMGKGGGALTEQLAGLLKDPDERVRVGALQAISALGPAAGAAAAAVRPLLDEPEMMIDAADALGRMGPAARPVGPGLVKMLSSDQAAVRWAAIRAMSQIGGEEAKPAVEFIVKALPKAEEVDSYNMHIYLALLGPVAKDAIPAIRAARLKNPILPTATIWAIDPEKAFPWQMGARMMGPMGGGDGPDISKFIFEAYFAELGERLKPAAAKLRDALLAGTAGDVPVWGYGLLLGDAQASTAGLMSHLADEDVAMRECAAVGLGYMGAGAAAATEKLDAAVKSASSEKERKLMAWAVRKVSGE